MKITLKRIKKAFNIKNIVLVLIAALFLMGGFYFWQKRAPETTAPVYGEIYRLVPEKVSQSAAIKITLPPNVARLSAQKNITFEPEIKGEWLPQDKEDGLISSVKKYFFASAKIILNDIPEIYYKPKEALRLNRYYSAKLTTSDGGLIKSDFLAVEDPEIVAVFPKENSEAPENSEITIVFNRPLVPLTTLGELEEKNVPVEITPVTEGRFKWISTNNLQFIPKDRLVRSSSYKVKINQGLVSMDGLPLKAAESQFFTRKLRYLNITSGQLTYNQPISIYFNQPVDLERTKNNITLIDNNTGKEIPFIAEYEYTGKNNNSSADEGKNHETGFEKVTKFLAASVSALGFKFNIPSAVKEGDVDKTIIRVYKKEDRFGREKFWDFENSYSLKINKAYPEEGDIILNERRESQINIANPIAGLSAESSRSEYAALDFFDPQGKLWVSFYEEIALDKSDIASQKMKEIGYGEKCKKEEGVSFYGDTGCEKITDKSRVYIIFKDSEIGLGERVEIVFNKIVNSEGLTVNKEAIARHIVSYPKLQILKTFPEQGGKKANITELILCSNSPLVSPPEEDYEDYIKSNLDYELNNWGESWRVDYRSEYSKCGVGEFRTRISYGLIPLSAYAFELKIEDHFGQKQDLKLEFVADEMPDAYLNFYHLQKSYNVTTPDKTKLTYAVENMEYVNMEICKLSALDFMYYLEARPSYDESSNVVTRCQEKVKDKIVLPKRYWVKNYFQVNIADYFYEPLGHYILMFSNPDYKTRYWGWDDEDSGKQIYERTYLTATNLSAAEKRITPGHGGWRGEIPLSGNQLKEISNLYWVTNISNLEPAGGAIINIYNGQKKGEFNLSATALTDNQGIAQTDAPYDFKGAVIKTKTDSAIIVRSESKLQWAETAFSSEKFYLYTDKAIYRPGQEVFFKGIYRVGYDGNYEIYKDKKIDFTVSNSRGDKILEEKLSVSDFGTFNTKIILPNDASLGSYRACAQKYSCMSFEVLEYAPAPFEVKLKTDKEEYISKDTVNMDIEANYYFGVSLEGGEVTYTVSSQNYYFDRYNDGYFDFDYGWYYSPPYQYGDRFILRGRTSLDNKGKARISQVIDLEKLFKNEEGRSKIVVFDVTVQNPQGQSISGQKSFIIHAGEFYLNAASDKSFLGKNETFSLKVKSTDIQGKETSVKNIAFNLYKVDWVYSKRQEAGGGYGYKWEKKREQVKTFNFDTDGQGNYSKELQISEEGEYEAEISARDQKNNLVRSTFYLYVYGAGGVSVRPTKDTLLEIEAGKTNLNVGEKGSIIIKSPYANAKALISIERGKVFEYQIREIKGNLYKFDFDIKDEYAPNVYVSVLLISSKPEVKFGQVEFQIDTERRELNVETKTNKTVYLPGEEVILDIFAKDYKQQPVSAEFSVAVVDLSVLALKGNPKKNPLIFFYGGFPLTVSTASNIKDILIEMEIPTKGGGGSKEAEAAGLAVKKRGVFKETAFWLAQVKTDEQGSARIKFTLPDNLTTWQLETLGVTMDTKLGIDYQEITTRKELMAVPLKPRFVIPGDVFYIGAQVFNQSGAKQKFAVTIESPNLSIIDEKPEREVEINAGETKTLYFKVLSPGSFKGKEHRFVISAKGGGLEDTVEQSIKVTANDTYEVTASSNYTNAPVWKEYVFLPDNIIKDKGELTIKNSATLAVFLSDALNYLMRFPYGCSEQIASKLDGIAIVKRGLNIPNVGEKFNLDKIEFENKEYSIDEAVQLGLSKLYSNQKWDGGFSFWKTGNTDFYLTLHIVDTLNNLSSAGFAVNQNSLNQAVEYLKKEASRGRWQSENEDAFRNRIILTSYTLFRTPNFNDSGFLRKKITEIAGDNLFINDKISHSALSYLAILLTNKSFDDNVKNKIFNTLDNRIDIDSRGAFLETGKNITWQYYETPVKNTALYLKAQTAKKSNNPIIDKVARWLLNSKKKDGAWGSTNNTISVIDAFTDYLEWKKETESNFVLDVSVNKESKGKYDINPQTVLDQFKTEIPISDLTFNENNIVQFLKTSRNDLPNSFYYALSLKYFLPVDRIPPRDEGFTITREIYKTDDVKNANPLNKANVGDVLKVHIQITVPATRNYVAVEDFIPAGMEIVNLDLSTEQKSLLLQEREVEGRELYPSFKELRDDRAFLFKESLRPGIYEFDYYVRALIKGNFNYLPAVVSEMYFPENFGRTAGKYFTVE